MPHGYHGKILIVNLSTGAMQIDEQALAIGYHVGLTAVSVVGGRGGTPATAYGPSWAITIISAARRG
jgi:hypothetical protein